jgi:hypothetical protein
MHRRARPPVRLTTGERAEPMRCRFSHVDAGSPDRGCVRQVVAWRDGYQPMRWPVWEGATDRSRGDFASGPPWLLGAMGGGQVAVRKQL